MPNNATINLDVRNSSSGGAGGYIDTTASNGAVYSYQYSGGSGNGGSVEFQGRGRVTVVVQLRSDARYTIAEVSFAADTHNQLSWVSNPNAPTTATIQNVNSVVQAAYYNVTVRDSTANCTVACDPMIINK